MTPPTQVHKPGKGAFYATDLEPFLRSKGITHLLFAGVTTEVGVRGGGARVGAAGLLIVDTLCMRSVGRGTADAPCR